jgi:hypothetical protein
MGTAPDMPALADRMAITDLIYRYCRAVDRLDISLGHSIWHAGGIADYGNFYQGDGRGVIDLICAQHLRLLHHSHQVSNILVDIDGDRAGSEAYVTATLRHIREARVMQMTVWSRYVDWWSRREGRWGLDKRIAIRDFDEIREVTEMQRYDTGRRDCNDLSYAALNA